MDITHIGNGEYMLSVQRSEVHAYYINEDCAKSLICSAFGLYSLPRGTTIELYDGTDSVLIFTHIPSSCYGFDNFEDVISACKNCSAEDSSLYFYDDEYILSVSFPNPYLGEFARNIPAGRDFLSFLKEHSRTIIPFDAVNFVKNTF